MFACGNSWDVNDSPSIETTEKTCGLAREAEYIGATVLANDAEKTSNIVLRWGVIWELSTIAAVDAHPELQKATKLVAETIADRDAYSVEEFSSAQTRVNVMCSDFGMWSLPKNSLADGVLIFDLGNNWKP